jgi:hypothetical protein
MSSTRKRSNKHKQIKQKRKRVGGVFGLPPWVWGPPTKEEDSVQEVVHEKNKSGVGPTTKEEEAQVQAVDTTLKGGKKTAKRRNKSSKK